MATRIEWSRKFSPCSDPYFPKLTCVLHRPLDTLSAYHFTVSKTQNALVTTQPTRYAIRQVLDQELRKEKILQASLTRQARGNGPPTSSSLAANIDSNKENIKPGLDIQEQKSREVKIVRDFFGRPISQTSVDSVATSTSNMGTSVKLDASSIAKSTATKGKAHGDGHSEGRIWVSFNEGFSNAVRKPITLADLMDGF